MMPQGDTTDNEITASRELLNEQDAVHCAPPVQPE